MEVVYYSASGGSYDVPYKRLDLDIFLKTCDIISCHAPLNERTNRLMNYSAFKKCKPEAVFLNLGRGPIVGEADLVKAIEDGKIAGAALDVYEKEPLGLALVSAGAVRDGSGTALCKPLTGYRLQRSSPLLYLCGGWGTIL